MKNLSILLSIGILFGSSFVMAQESTEVSMITNRPGVSESSRAVYKGGLQFEMGLQYVNSPIFKSLGYYSESLYVPNLGVLYGIGENVEIRAFGNLQGDRTYFKDLDKGSYDFNFTGLTIGTKINLFKRDGWIPELALVITQGFPTTDDAIKLYPTTALLSWSYGFNDFGLQGNFSYRRDFASDNSSTFNQDFFSYTLAGSYAITSQFGAFAEVYGTNPIGAGEGLEFKVDGGFWYSINSKLQVDLQGGYGFEAEDYFVMTGVSWLIIK